MKQATSVWSNDIIGNDQLTVHMSGVCSFWHAKPNMHLTAHLPLMNVSIIHVHYERQSTTCYNGQCSPPPTSQVFCRQGHQNLYIRCCSNHTTASSQSSATADQTRTDNGQTRTDNNCAWDSQAAVNTTLQKLNGLTATVLCLVVLHDYISSAQAWCIYSDCKRCLDDCLAVFWHITNNLNTLSALCR